MLATILSWIASGGLSGITKSLENAYTARLKAATDSEKLATDLKIRELEARRDSILAAQRDKFERWVRIGFAAPFVAYNAKLIIYDKMLGWGVTDPLSAELSQIQMTVIAGYFLFASVKAVRK